MKFAVYLCSLGLCLLMPGHARADSATNSSVLTRWERAAATNRQLTADIIWQTHEPLDFLLRRGDHFDDEPERYAHMGDPENIQRMADAGVRYAMIYFYKGFGLEYERPAMAESKRIADELHAHGIKVGLYMGGTMFTETLYHELPEAKNWEQRNQDNHWVPYGLQTYRHYACPNEPAYRDYLKKILKIGVEDLHADQIVFDNIMLQPEPDSCRCPRCLAAFHDFLRKKYPTKAAVLRRFGLPDVDWIIPNEWDNAAQPEELSVLNDPVLQEWTRFRCESLANYADDLSDYVKSLNPNVAVLMNIKGVYSWNRYWANAVYHPLYAGHVDILAFDTGGYDARIDAKTGALVSQIRSYKMARDLGASCDAPLGDDLLCAQHMAFAYESPVAGYAGSPWMAARSGTTPMLEFYRNYFQRYYTGTKNVADVAMLRNWPSMAYSLNATYTPATLMEQVLIQHKIPFDLLFDEELTNLDRYQSVILAGQECVADAQVKLLLDYVRRGGTLIITDNTGEYNGWREKRHQNPFLPARTEGRGRIVYVSKIVPDVKLEKTAGGNDDAEPGAASQATPKMSPPQWLLPKNHQEIYDAIAGNLPRGLSLTSDAPVTTVAELLTRPETQETIVHFVNFDRQHPLSPFPAAVRSQFGGKVKSVTCFSPDAEDPVNLDFEVTGDTVSFTVPSLRIYSMIVIAQ
ncbi:MAG TPA: beta-galactosidase [Candidatus Sulfotelmatobacter sp.]|nr:beta-galactosidase [Candidatus Sulfotelmatobacter sp.]